MNYSTKYYAYVSDDSNNVYTINIDKLNYTGSTTEITDYSIQPLLLRYRGGRNTFEEGEALFPSSVVFTFYSKSDNDFTDIFESENRDFQIEIIKTTNSVSSTFWKGWADPSMLTKTFIADAYYVTIEANCGLLDLKEIDYPSPSGDTLLINILKTSISQTGIELDIADQLNISEANSTEPLLKSIYANTQRFLDEEDGREKYLNCFDTTERLLDSFNCQLAQVNGRWTITQKNEINSKLHTYDFSSLTASTSTYNREIDVSSYSVLFGSDEQSKISPIKQFGITYQNRNVQRSVVTNGTFDTDTTGWSNGTGATAFFNFGVSDGRLFLHTREPGSVGDDGTHSFTSSNFQLTQLGTGNTITVSLQAQVDAIDFNSFGKTYPKIKLELVYPDLSTDSSDEFSTDFFLTDGIKLYSETFVLDQDGNYSLKISIIPAESSPYETASFFIDNIKAIPDYGDTDLTYDKYFQSTNTGSTAVQRLERTTYFGDSANIGDLGALKYSSTGLTSSWSNYSGVPSGVSLMNLLAYNVLQERQGFNDYVRITLKADSTINFNSILKINDQKFRIVEMNHDLRNENLELGLVEIIKDAIGVSFVEYLLLTIDGQSTSSGNGSSVLEEQFEQFVTTTNTTLNSHTASIATLEAYNLQDITENGNSTNEGIVFKNTGNTKSFRLSIDESTGHLLISGGSNQNIHVSGDVIAYSSSLPPSTDWWENAPLGTGLVYSGGTINVTGGTGGGSTTTASNGLTKSGNNIVLGGALTGNTTISGAYDLTLSEGDFGIGRTPTRTLDIYRSGENVTVMASTNTAHNVSFRLQRTVETATDWEMYLPAGSTDLRIYKSGDKVTFGADGKVGIGKAPTSLLTIGTTAANSINFGTTDSTVGLNIRNDGTNAVIANKNSGNLYIGYDGNASQNLYFYGGGTTAHMTLNTSGNVGIGTTSPSSLAPSRVGLSIDSSDNGGFLDIKRNGSTALRFITDSTLASFIQSANDLRIQVNGTERVRMDTTGRVGIGTTSIDHTLVLSDVTAGGSQLKFVRGTGVVRVLQDNNLSRLYIRATNNLILNDTGGNVGIGTSGPSFNLDVSSSSSFAKVRAVTSAASEAGFIVERTVNTPTKWEFYTPIGSTDIRLYNAGDRFTFSSSGNLTASGEITAYSDRRLKENIENYNKGLSSVLAIQPVQYQMKCNTRQHIGVIAQDVQKIEPLLVESNNGTLSVNYQKISVMLINAVKELSSTVDELKKEIELLKNNNTKKTRNKKT